jgi:hypothetical protein
MGRVQQSARPQRVAQAASPRAAASATIKQIAADEAAAKEAQADDQKRGDSGSHVGSPR